MSDVRFVDNSSQALTAILHLRDVAITESAIHAEEKCVRLCPVDTGHLRASINYRTHIQNDGEQRPDGLDGLADDGEAVIGTNVEYAPHVEYGTRFQRAQPFMRNGIDAALPGIRTIFKRRLGDVDVRQGGV